MAFDTAEYIRTRNEAETANRAGKSQEAVATEKPADKPAETPGTPTRSERRAMNRMREEIGELRGRLKAYEEMGITKKPEPEVKVAEDPEPQRKDFTSDAEYNRALGKWDARQEAAKIENKLDQKTKNEQELSNLRALISDMDKKAEEDKKLIPDFDKVAEAALEDEDQPQFNPAEHPYLMRRLATSDVKAFLLHHLAKNPQEMEKLLGLTSDLEKQTSFISRLEGRVEKMYSSEGSKKEKVAETTAERDAKKTKPSEAGAPRGGNTPERTISPLLADGKTINPAWEAARNERTGRR